MKDLTLLLAALVLSTGCYNPDTSHLVILCDAERPECPVGQTCINNRCSAASSDMDPPDQSLSSDGSAPDQSMPSGCADGGGQKVGIAFACPGAFQAGDARKKCASGWRVCTSGLGVDFAACGQLPGFFIAEAPSYWLGTMADERCSTALFNQAWYGCGGRKDSVRQGKGCNDFRILLDCLASGWNCNMKHEIDKTSNTNSSDGVLCCR